jgi:hypothetical protein
VIRKRLPALLGPPIGVAFDEGNEIKGVGGPYLSGF